MTVLSTEVGTSRPGRARNVACRVLREPAPEDSVGNYGSSTVTVGDGSVEVAANGWIPITTE
jgi:hypothetical protein